MRSLRSSVSMLFGNVGPNGVPLFGTIRARLYCAFGFAAVLTFIGSVTAVYEFTSIGAATNDILSYSFPATVVSLRLAEEASGLVSLAPRLMTAADDKTRIAVTDKISEQAKDLKEGTERLKLLGIAKANDIDVAREALMQRLATLSQIVKDRIVISNKRQYFSSSIQPAHEALTAVLVPAIDDANFDLMTRNKLTPTEMALNSEIEYLRRLFETQSESNLLAGLLTEASLVDESSRLEPLRDLIGSAMRKIEENVGEIRDPALKRSLKVLSKKLGDLGSNNGIVTLRAVELARQGDAQAAFAATQTEAANLKLAVDALVEQQSEIAKINSRRVADQIHSGEILLIILAVTAIIAAVLIAWLYVGRNVVRRLGSLSDAMRRVASGDFDVQIENRRGDEIGDMASALRVFRQTTLDATAAHRKEIEQARALESRRQTIEAATQNFELAVSKVIKTLDRAAMAMESSGRDMAASANRNQGQALATAAASDETMANVENVAGSAEELARSIEHITTRVADSAAMARQATSEAQAIAGTVESLSESVEEIEDIAKLIRNIAGQTNLLALNATIEAARAGEAGRGFAVVAQEVKGLAAETGKATEEITRQILNIEEATSRSVSTMKAIATTILRLDDLANDVAAAVRQQGTVTQEIARNASAAAKGARDVSANIAEVSSTAIKTGEVAGTVSTAATELANESQQLREEVERYLAQVRVA
jgi:methyl-accepting chemotaxis protein